jgi:transcription initiation factor TFIID subunit 6
MNLLEIICALHLNPNINLEFQLHIIIKILVHLVSGPSFTLNTNEDDLPLRDKAARTLMAITLGYEFKYPNLRFNITQLLLELLPRLKDDYKSNVGLFRVHHIFFDLNGE